MIDIKKIVILLAVTLNTLALYAQETRIENNTDIPLSLDSDSTGDSVESSSASSNLDMGLWIELSADSKFLTRDIASGEKKGFEANAVNLKSKGNWWFWGELSEGLYLDAEISVWNGTYQMYQANSYADNIPDVTVVDGIQNLGSIAFSPISGLVVGSPGFNKLGLDWNTEWFRARLGYRNLKSNGMTGFTGIFNTIDPWDDTGKGYLELENGERWQSIGENLDLKLLLGLSRTRPEFGIYNILDISSPELFQSTFVFSSSSESSELFRYDESNSFSLYLKWLPISFFDVSFHGLGGYKSSQQFKYENLAGALAIKIKLDNYKAEVIQSAAGPMAITVWGDDTTLYSDSLHTKLIQEFFIGSNLSIKLLNDLNFEPINLLPDGSIRLQNNLTLYYAWKSLLKLDMESSIYGTYELNQSDTVSDQSIHHKFSEAGLKIQFANLAQFSEELIFDYAVSTAYLDNNIDKIYNSIMITNDFTSQLSASLASMIRINLGENSKQFVPFGIGTGFKLQTGWVKSGSPIIWANAVWGMDPYDSDGWTLNRQDNSINGYTTYRLKDVYEYVGESHLRIGMVWNLQ